MGIDQENEKALADRAVKLYWRIDVLQKRKIVDGKNRAL
jgi:hypothetical protein